MTTESGTSVARDGQVNSDVLLLGAAGNSGRLIAAELAARGLSVRLAGRRRGPLEDLARALAADGATTDMRTVDVRDAASLTEAIVGVGVVLGAAALAGLHLVDGGELLVGGLEIEDVEVLGDPFGLARLGDDRAAVLDSSAEHHLGPALAVRVGDLRDDGVFEGAGVAAVAVEGDAADGRTMSARST